MARSLFARLQRKYGSKDDLLSRREMLKATLVTSAGLLVPATALGQDAKRVDKRIVVVGAGFAGLACADLLKSKGYDVTVVEARDRLGGRVVTFTDFVKDKTVEGGGELIGKNHPTWMGYKERFGLEFLDVSDEDEFEMVFSIGGKRLTGEEAKKVYEEMEAALGKMNDDARKIDADEPWKSPDAAKLDARNTADWIAKSDASDLTKKAMTIELTANNGQPPEKQSYLGNLAQVAGGGVETYWTDTETNRCKGGNQLLATKLAEAFGKERIILKLAVTEIAQKGDKMVLTCADHRTLECDDVVLAVPPSVWGKINFDPDLPGPLKSAQMGANIKYITAFKSRFWREKKLSQYAYTDTPLGMTWESTDAQGDEGEFALNYFNGGSAAETCLSWPDAKRDEMFKTEMDKLYPGYSANWQRARFMDWPRQQWTMASYSFPAPGEVTRVGPLLRKGHGHVHFAGEHTCYKFVGYMEGALNSGVALAGRLAARDGVKKA